MSVPVTINVTGTTNPAKDVLATLHVMVEFSMKGIARERLYGPTTGGDANQQATRVI